jgi:hypothetical protein
VNNEGNSNIVIFCKGRIGQYMVYDHTMVAMMLCHILYSSLGGTILFQRLVSPWWRLTQLVRSARLVRRVMEVRMYITLCSSNNKVLHTYIIILIFKHVLCRFR